VIGHHYGTNNVIHRSSALGFNRKVHSQGADRIGSYPYVWTFDFLVVT
jgi:hypothetical protein